MKDEVLGLMYLVRGGKERLTAAELNVKSLLLISLLSQLAVTQLSFPFSSLMKRKRREEIAPTGLRKEEKITNLIFSLSSSDLELYFLSLGLWADDTKHFP